MVITPFASFCITSVQGSYEHCFVLRPIVAGNDSCLTSFFLLLQPWLFTTKSMDGYGWSHECLLPTSTIFGFRRHMFLFLLGFLKSDYASLVDFLLALALCTTSCPTLLEGCMWPLSVGRSPCILWDFTIIARLSSLQPMLGLEHP